MAKAKSKAPAPVRTVSLVRIEPHMSATYLIVCIDEAAEPGSKSTPEDRVKFLVEIGAPPEGIFPNVVAVVREGLSRPPHLFTVVETKVVPGDFHWDDLGHGRRDWASLFDLSGGVDD